MQINSHGFAAAGFTQAASEIGGEGLFIEGAESLPDRASNAIKAAIIGGSASVLSGGKFGNGAITGAFSRLLNDDAVSRKSTDRSIYAAEDGEIETVGWEDPNDYKKGYGYRLKLRAAQDSSLFIYGHLDPSSLAVTPEASVKRGQYLGKYADPSNGGSTAPHLHFEQWSKDGVRLDPAVYRSIVLPNYRQTDYIRFRSIHPVTGKARWHNGYDLVGGLK